MPLGHGITQMWEAVQDRVEVSEQGRTWRVTAGSFESALAYARERFGEPAVLTRTDRDRWWPRVTLTVTTDPALAASAPPLERLATSAVPSQPTSQPTVQPTAEPRTTRVEQDVTADTDPASAPLDKDPDGHRGLPPSLEAIFAHQEELRLVRQRRPDHDGRPGVGVDADGAGRSF